MHILKPVFIIVIFALFTSCASKVRPGGGDKDIEPPKALSITPEKFSTNFNSNEVIIEFDEYIQLKDVQLQVITSPIIDPPPTFSIKKKSLIIDLPKNLRPNTTYNINFGTSIVDLHESNVAQNFQYVFSTGPVLDSLKLSGKVLLAHDNGIAENVVVMLHKNLTDTIFKTGTPNYITKANEFGRFNLSNVSPGTYKLYGLIDENSNYIFDRQEEVIAFESNTITLPDSSLRTLRLFNNNPEKIKINASLSLALGKQLLVFNLPLDSSLLKISGTDNNIIFRKYFGKNKDSLLLCWNNIEQEKISVEIKYNNLVLDTIKISNAKKIKKRAGSQERDFQRLTTKINLVNGSFINRITPLVLKFNNPVLNFNNDSVVLLADSIPVEDFGFSFSENSPFKAVFNFAFQDDVIYTLRLLPGTVTDFFGNTNDTIIQPFSLRPERQYGSLRVNFSKINSSDGELFLQLIKGEKIVYRQVVVDSNSVELLYLNPESYTLRLVMDSNKNSKWDTGEYEYNIQPEHVLNYTAPVNIRANWDVVLDWNIK